MHVPLSLKMSATWENEKLSSSIVPRICNLNITQVIFDRLLEDMTDGSQYSFFVSIRMRDNTRRVLRSPELTFPSIVPDVVYLDFSCSIQYSHALKRDSCNYLQLLIQRRKKYRNKSVNLGYKTVAYCTIDLGQVLQRRIENRFLELYDDPKSPANVIGRVEVKCLSTMAAEKDLVLERRKDIFDEEDEGVHDQFSEPDDSDRVEDSDNDQNVAEFGESSSRQKKIMKVNGHRGRRRSSSPSAGFPEWQKQIKQKIMGLLKKVKLMEHNEELDPHDTSQIWDEIEQLSNVSGDSDIEDMDSTSIQSMPRPMLPPYFSQTTLPNHPGICVSNYTINKTRTKVRKKLQLETASSNAFAFNNINFVDVVTSTRDKLRPNDGSETTEDESKSVSVAKKTSCSPDKEDITLQRSSSKNKSKSSKTPVQNPTNNTIKKEPPKPKKQMSGILKTFSFTTAATTIPVSSIIVTNNQRSVLADSNFISASNDAHNSSGTFSASVSTMGSYFMTSSAIHSPLSAESIKENTNSEINPRFELMEHVNQFLLNHGDCLDIIYIINLSDYGGKYVSDMFHKENVDHIEVTCFADSKFAITQILNWIRKKSDHINKICLLGSDCHLNNILRVFVDQININFSKEIVNCFRFFLIPITGFALPDSMNQFNQFSTQGNMVSNNMARRICSIDSQYASLFLEFIQMENITSSDSVIERDNKFMFRVHDYLRADGILHCPIGDCLVACTVKPQNLTQDFESSAESFIPFLCEVRLGESSDFQLNKPDSSVDDQWQVFTTSSPPQSPIVGNFDYVTKFSLSAISPAIVSIPNSIVLSNTQNVAASSLPNNSSTLNISPPQDGSSLELQLEYWTDHSSKKVTLKSSFRQVVVSQTMVTASCGNPQHSLSLTIISKEKKQKIMRITKKAKQESDSKKETFDDIIRILCTSKSQNSLIRVTVDGVVWTGVKFFQLNPYWRTQIKTFPIASFSHFS